MAAPPEQPPGKNTPHPASIKAVEQKLDEMKARVDDLGEEISKAEAKRPPPIDHADDGGVF